MPRKAFIGEPRDVHGNAVACGRCDRRASTLVGNEPRCAWHVTETLPASVKNGLLASQRDRGRQRR